MTRRLATLAVLASVAVIAPCSASSIVRADLDAAFGSPDRPGVVTIESAIMAERGMAVATLPDGSALVASGTFNGAWVQRYTSTGVLDPTFGDPSTPGRVELPLDPIDIAVTSTGGVLVTGSSRQIGLGQRVMFRMSTSGVLDPSFDGGSIVGRIAAPFQVDDRIALTGAILMAFPSSYAACVQRFVTSTGGTDPTFGTTAAGLTCVDGFGGIGATAAVHHADGTYLLAAASGDAGSAITLVDLDAGGHVGSNRTIPANIGEYAVALLAQAGDGLVVGAQRNGFVDGVLHRYIGTSPDPSFAGATGGDVVMPGFRIARVVALVDGRLLVLGRAGGHAEVRLLTADGRPDGAMSPGSSSPDRLRLPSGSFSGWTPTSASFVDADVSGERPVFGGLESDSNGISAAHQVGILARATSIGPSTPIDTPVPSAAGYVALVPERVLDTRPGTTVGYSGAKPGPNVIVSVRVTGVGASQVPASARAVVLNVTGTEATADGYVTVWPCGSPRPLAANLNLVSGGTRPNLVIVGLGTGGEVCIYTQSGAHLVADLSGYMTASSTYRPTVPARLLDTRSTTQVGYVGPKPAAHSVIELQVTGSGPGLAPADATAVVLNLTGLEAESGSYVTVWPCGSPRPFTANLNLAVGEVAPNLVTATVGLSGKVCLYSLSADHLVADISGWYVGADLYTPVGPSRLLDTRATAQVGYTGSKPGAGAVVVIHVASGPSAAVINVVGVDPTDGGFVTVWPCGGARPLAANLNLRRDVVGANAAIVGIGTGGTVCLFTQSGTDFVVDLTGYLTG